MFSAGMETDLTELKKTGKASFIIAIFGVLIPLIGGFLVAYIFSSLDNSTTNNITSIMDKINSSVYIKQANNSSGMRVENMVIKSIFCSLKYI